MAGAAGLAWAPFDEWVQPVRFELSDATDLWPGAGAPYVATVVRHWTNIWCWPWQVRTPARPSAEPAMWCVLVRPPLDEPYPLLRLLSEVGAGTTPARSGFFVFAFEPDKAVIRHDCVAKGEVVTEPGSDWRAAFRRWTETVAVACGAPDLPEQLGPAVVSVLAAPPGRTSPARHAGLAADSGGQLSSPEQRDLRFGGAALAVAGLLWLAGASRLWRSCGDGRSAPGGQ